MDVNGQNESLYPQEPQSLGNIHVNSYLITIPTSLVSDNEEALEDNVSDEEQMVEQADDQTFKITDTEDSRLFRKFLISWEKYFNSKPQVGGLEYYLITLEKTFLNQVQSNSSKKSGQSSILNIVNVAKQKQLD